MYLYEMTWIELYVDSSCPVCNKWLNLNRSEESLHMRLHVVFKLITPRFFLIDYS